MEHPPDTIALWHFHAFCGHGAHWKWGLDVWCVLIILEYLGDLSLSLSRISSEKDHETDIIYLIYLILKLNHQPLVSLLFIAQDELTGLLWAHKIPK